MENLDSFAGHRSGHVHAVERPGDACRTGGRVSDVLGGGIALPGNAEGTLCRREGLPGDARVRTTMIADVLLVAAIPAFSWLAPSALFMRKVREAGNSGPVGSNVERQNRACGRRIKRKRVIGTAQNDKVEPPIGLFALAKNYPCASKPRLTRAGLSQTARTPLRRNPF